MAVVGWVDTADVIGGDWRDAAQLDIEDLTLYLTAAYEQCVAYLPDPELVPYPATIPESWKLAQTMQARALFRSVKSGDNNGIGADGYTITVFPMDWTVKNLLRPKRIGRVR